MTALALEGAQRNRPIPPGLKMECSRRVHSRNLIEAACELHPQARDSAAGQEWVELSEEVTATNPATAEAAITALSRAAQLIQPVQPERLH